jgi:hypothetical protein
MRPLRFWSGLLIALVLAPPNMLGAEQAIVRQHSGATDPLSEAFILSLDRYSTVGPVSNDLGVASWKVKSAGYPADYSLSLTAQEQALVAGQDLAFSATLRVIKGGNMYLVLRAESRYFLLGFDQQPDGDPIVSAESGPPYSLSPVFVLEGGGAGYHSYALAYSGATGQAGLWVDGVQRLTALPSVSGVYGWGGYWGAVQGGSSEANWSSVTFAIVPEPSCLALFGCGGLVVWARWLREAGSRRSSAARGRSGGLAFQPAQSGAEAPACRAVTGTVTELNALPNLGDPCGGRNPESCDECLLTAVLARLANQGTGGNHSFDLVWLNLLFRVAPAVQFHGGTLPCPQVQPIGNPPHRQRGFPPQPRRRGQLGRITLAPLPQLRLVPTQPPQFLRNEPLRSHLR